MAIRRCYRQAVVSWSAYLRLIDSHAINHSLPTYASHGCFVCDMLRWGDQLTCEKRRTPRDSTVPSHAALPDAVATVELTRAPRCPATLPQILHRVEHTTCCPSPKTSNLHSSSPVAPFEGISNQWPRLYLRLSRNHPLSRSQ